MSIPRQKGRYAKSCLTVAANAGLNRIALSASDVVKTLIGTFVGAGAAFYGQHRASARIEKRDNLAAGRLALLVIRAQLDDFANYRRAMRIALNLTNIQLGQALQNGRLENPMAFNFGESNVFKYESLAFCYRRRQGERLLRGFSSSSALTSTFRQDIPITTRLFRNFSGLSRLCTANSPTSRGQHGQR